MHARSVLSVAFITAAVAPIMAVPTPARDTTWSSVLSRGINSHILDWTVKPNTDQNLLNTRSNPTEVPEIQGSSSDIPEFTPSRHPLEPFVIVNGGNSLGKRENTNLALAQLESEERAQQEVLQQTQAKLQMSMMKRADADTETADSLWERAFDTKDFFGAVGDLFSVGTAANTLLNVGGFYNTTKM